MTKKEWKKLQKRIAKLNNLEPEDVLIFVDDKGVYYDWAVADDSIKKFLKSKKINMSKYLEARYPAKSLSTVQLKHLITWSNFLPRISRTDLKLINLLNETIYKLQVADAKRLGSKKLYAKKIKK